MSDITLASLGITEDQLTDKLVDRLCDRLLDKIQYDEDGDEWFGKTDFGRKITQAIQGRIDNHITAIADDHVLPNVKGLIEGVTLQKTNEWGEARGASVSFIEYLVSRADAYLTEPVDMNGDDKKSARSSFWKKSSLRIDYMIDKHLKYNIERAMKEALKTANEKIVGGLERAVIEKLSELKVALDVKVKS